MTDVNPETIDETSQQPENAEQKTDTVQEPTEPVKNGVSTTTDDDVGTQNEKNEAPEAPTTKTEELDSAPPQPSEPSRTPSEPVAEPQPEAPARTSVSPARSRTDQPPASQSPLPANTPKRPDIDRNSNSSISSIRPQPHLPNRPEPSRDFRRPDMRVPMRPPDIADERWDARDARHPDHSRYGRYNDQDRERMLDPPSMHERGHGRLNERSLERERMAPARGDRDFPSRPASDDHFQRPPFRDSHLPPRDQEWADRAPRARPSQSDLFSSRQHDQDRSARGMAPPHKPPPHHERGAIRDGPSGDDDGTRGLSQPRADRDDRRMHPSRQLSPPRVDDSRLPNRPDRRDERFPSDDRRSGNFPPSHASRHDDLLPTGPRGERSSRGGPTEDRPAVDFPRDSRMGPLPPQDPNHGRLNQGSRYTPAAHDTLNDRPPPDIPLGPRGRNTGGRGSRPGSVSQAPPPNNPPVQASERQPPTGPSSRPGTRGALRQEQPPASSNSRPSTPAGEKLDATGIHPDRLKALQGSSNTGFDNPSPRAPSPPAPILPPSGPRGAPSGPSPTTRGPPTGPSFAGERGRGDKRFAGLNNMLQQSSGMSSDRGGQGTTIRGRGANANRQSSASMNAPSPQSMGPPTPVGPQSESQGPSADAGSGRDRPDLFASRKNEAEDESLGPSRSGGGRRSEIVETSSEPRRSSRNQSSSGTHTPDRDRDRERERDRTRNRDRDRDRDRDSSRRGEEDNAKKRDHDRDRRANENPAPSRDDVPDTREPSRRTGGSGRDEAPSTRRRERRGRDEGVNSSSLGGDYSNADRSKPPPPPPPPAPPQNDDRRWGGAGGGRNEEREREREPPLRRDRNRSRREDNSGGTLPRKRGRPPVGDDGSRAGGMRVGSDHKRPRR